ncbi:MAG: hypothetical protein D3923_00270 [Candidatus Electrothrix sp. AR3]|nr:hypothetical protein [Candidatus Electrothrix sp. AR3]
MIYSSRMQNALFSSLSEVVLIILLFLMPLTGLAAPREAMPHEPPPPLQDDGKETLISYTAPFHQILLTRNFHITDTEQISEYANPVSGVPSKTVTVSKSTQADIVDVMELLLFIRKSNFSRLKENYGGKAEERGYPYTIIIHDAGTKKEVMYRSRPDTEARPETFSQVENKIIEFAKKATEIKTGD